MAVAIRDGIEHELSWRITPTCNQAIEEYHAVAKKYNLDFYQMAIAFTLRREYLSCSIIGASSLSQLKGNIAAIDLELSEEVLREIEKYTASTRIHFKYKVILYNHIKFIVIVHLCYYPSETGVL